MWPMHSLDGLPYASLWRIAARGWKKEPEDRPSIHQMLQNLRALTNFGEETIDVHTKTSAGPQSHPPPSNISINIDPELDISDMVEFADKMPKASGGFCDVYRGVYKGDQAIALKIPRARYDDAAKVTVRSLPSLICVFLITH